jgi:hypothetical protein
MKRPTRVEQGQIGLMTGFLPEVQVDLLAESCLEQEEGYGQETSSQIDHDGLGAISLKADGRSSAG